ncbi:peroxiredoxin [Sphingomonas sp.]|uniref:peroxiredoxin n=1 Tax=Sphingomonas sp. TaxID=28214 RepID=UPI0035C7B34D
MRLPFLLFAAVSLVAAIAPGARAPDFTTQGALAGKVVNVHLSAQLKRGPVVLYFFPAAFTGGCNAEARAFAEAVPQFRAAGATVIGMSGDAVADLQRFSSSECAGKFPVATADAAILKGFGVLRPEAFRGRQVSSRTSFVIARDGRVAFVHDDPSPTEHVTQTLAAVKRLKR